MSVIAHSHIRAIVPEIIRNMCAIAPKGSLLSILVLSIERFIGARGVKRPSFEHPYANDDRLLKITLTIPTAAPVQFS